ncbi:MAG: hypothetical protein AABZ07_04865 [Nitrospirota bacterium]
MEITIFDVEHGACSLIKFPNGVTKLIDCGHNAGTDWRPSSWLVQSQISLTNLTITNMDEDHVSDLPNIYEYCKPLSLTKNQYISSAWVRNAKEEFGMGEGIEKACEMIDKYTSPISIDWGGAVVKTFNHSLVDFQDENSLSVVTFIFYKNMGIVFPGDLTIAGWQKFLNNAEFCDLLKKINIFVASHHGRDDGYEPDVFKICKPEIIMISDKSIMHDTQDVDYSQHASGIRWGTNDFRKV